MPFVLRVTSPPPLSLVTAIPQIVIIDQTGPAVTVGIGALAVAMVGEFLKGPFVPVDVTSGGQFLSLYGGISSILSQDGSATPVQDGSGVQWNGNGALALMGRRFQRLVLQRVDCDMTTTDGGTTKALVEFVVDIATSDQDPNSPTLTGRDIIIPAGTRFADDSLSLATAIVALSQDVTIPKGTSIVSNKVTVDQTFVNGNGTLGATAFFVKGTTLAMAALDTVLDPALPNVNSTISASGISSITSAGAATAIFAAGTAALALAAKIASRYPSAIDKLLPNDSPQNQVKAVWSARRTSAIRQKLVAHAEDASTSSPIARVAIVAADPAAGTSATQALAALNAAEALAFTESYQVDRAIVTFPMHTRFSTDLQESVLLNSDSLMANILSQFPSEKNPGADPSPFLDDVTGMEPAFALNPLSKQDYINLQAGGVSALQKDPTVNWWFVNGVTAVNPVAQPTRVPIKRRMMADEIQGSLAQIAAPYLKQPATTERVDSFTGEMDAYLGSLLSANNPALQRISGYFIDSKSGNTDELEAIGIFTFIIAVRLLASMDDIILQTQIGETVVLPQAA